MKFSKKADLKEYSNEATKGINDFIIQNPKIMSVVIDAAKRATDEKSFTDWLQEALTGEGMEEGVRKEVKWEELGWAWFNTVNRETTEPTSTDIIEQLPTLDKPKKIDELLEQLSIEQDDTKKEKIKQHIERIKRAKLLKADFPTPPPQEDPGSKEISVYDPAYSFLVRLVKLVSKEFPQAIPEIKQLAEQHPFKTVADIEYLTTQIWNLATTKYNIPREWLISKLPEKKGSLNKKADMGKFWIYPDGDYEQINEDSEHQDWLQEVEGLDAFQAFDKGWIRASVDNNLGSYQLKDFNNIPEYLDNFIVSHPSKEIEIADRNGYNYIKISYEDAINKGIQKAVKRSLVNASKTADLWPAQEQAGDMLSHEHNSLSYSPLQEADTSVSGPRPDDSNDDALWDIVVNEFFTAKKSWSEVVKAIRLAHPEVTDEVILSLKDRVRKSLDNQMGFTASKKVAYHAISDLTQFALDDKQIQQHFINRGTTVEDVIASLPNFKIEYITKDLEQRDPSLRDSTRGFYDFKSGTLYINPRLSLDSKRLTIIHEIEHAIQDAAGVLPVHTPEDIYKVRQTPYQDRSFEWGARQQQFNALKARGMSLDEIKQVMIERAIGNGKHSEAELNYIKENVSNEAEQMNEIYESMMPESVMASKKQAKHKLNMDQVIKILDSKENKVDHVDFTDNSITLINGDKLTFDEATTQAMEIDKEGVFSGAEFSTDDVGVNPSMDSGPWASPEDHGKDPQKHPFPNTFFEPANEEEDEAQPYSNIASSKKFSKLDVKANPSTRYWIAPDGKEFPVSGIHPTWILENGKILKKYGINPRQASYKIHEQMINSGWSRISTEYSGFQIEVADLSRLPGYLDDFIAKNFQKGDEIVIGNGKDKGVFIRDPFPTLQQAVNKALRNPVNASKKQAAISGQIIRDILEIVESSGGITYSLSKGNLSGTDNYAVSIYPDKERIVDGVVDFDDIQNYIDTNEDLLNQPDNSLGIWSSNGKIYYDVVITIPDKEKALELAKQNNQLAIFDLKNLQEISTGIVRAFSKKTIVKKAERIKIRISENEAPLTVIINPSYNEALGELKRTSHGLRMLTDADNNAFIWSAYRATHDEVARKLHENGYTATNTDSAGFLDNEQCVRSVFGSLNVKAEESILPEDYQNQVAAKWCPAMNIALVNYSQAVKNGHEASRAFDYALQSVSNIDSSIKESDLREAISAYLGPEK